MAEHYQARSKSNWGRETPKSAAELNQLCNEFFEKLKVPDKWKFLGWSNAVDIESETLLSVGKVFRDLRTSNMKLMHYRVWFNSFSGKGGVVEKSTVDYGEHKHTSVAFNKTIDELNEFIRVKYTHLERGRWWRMRKGIVRKRQLKESIYDYCN